MTKVARKIIEKLLENGMSQKEIAMLMDVAPSTVSRIRKGRILFPRTKRVERLQEIYEKNGDLGVV